MSDAGDGIPNLSRAEVTDRLRDAGIEDADRYAELLSPSIWISINDTKQPGLMESRFGGPAMMPEGFVWPMYTAEPYMGRDPDDDPETFTLWCAKQQQLPMFLIAQLNLAELPRDVETPLPPDGLLSFFTDPFDGVWGHSKSDIQGLRVIYVPRDRFAELRPYEKPSAAVHPGAFADRKWPALRIEYFVKWGTARWRALYDSVDDEPDSDMQERLREVLNEIASYSFGNFLLDGGCNHQGDPRESAVCTWDPPPETSDDATLEEIMAEQKEIERRAAGWTCLFSITKCEKLRPVVSDTGGLSFLIRKSDLAERRFERVWIVRS
jgi:uncharacterized protein YwqG